MVIEAAIWQAEYKQKQDIALAWRVAALMRSKRLPPLKQLLSAGPAKPLKGKELEERRQEFREAGKGFDANAYMKKLRKDGRIPAR